MADTSEAELKSLLSAQILLSFLANVALLSAYVYLLGWLYLVGYWGEVGVDLSLLGYSVGDIMTASYAPNVKLFDYSLEFFICYFLLQFFLKQIGSVGGSSSKDFWLRQAKAFFGTGALLIEGLYPMLILLSVLFLPLHSYQTGSNRGQSILKDELSVSNQKVHVTFKPEAKAPQSQQVVLASQADKLFLLTQTKELVIVVQRLTTSQVILFYLSRSDLLSVDVEFQPTNRRQKH